MNDPVAMLKREHREVEELLTKLQDSKPGPRRRSNVEKVVSSLTLHMEMEEKIVYPVIKRVVGTEEEEEAEIEHRLAREALEHLHEMVDEPGFGAVVDMLKAGIKHHVKEEEKELFPEMKKKIDRAELAEMGDELVAMKSAAKGKRPAGARS